jgi:hypothetical protein
VYEPLALYKEKENDRIIIVNNKFLKKAVLIHLGKWLLNEILFKNFPKNEPLGQIWEQWTLPLYFIIK